jgi:hypothetical protein
MSNQLIAHLKSLQGMITATMLAFGSAMTMHQQRQQLHYENLAPTNGNFLSPVWFAFHDGSFDLYDLIHLPRLVFKVFADGGVTGLEGPIPNYIEAVRVSINDPTFDGTYPSFIQDALLSNVFANSSAGLNDGIQDIVFSEDKTLSSTSRTFATWSNSHKDIQHRQYCQPPLL